MTLSQDPDRGCRGVLIWLVIIFTTFVVCVAVGITIFALNIREHGGKVVRTDLFSLIDTAQMPEDEKVALKVRIDHLIEAYQEERLTQDDFIAQSVAIREDLLAKQPAGTVDPSLVAPAGPEPSPDPSPDPSSGAAPGAGS